MINWTPQPIAFALGPLEVHWYGIMYAIGLAVTYLVVEREALRRGLDTGLLVNGFIVIAFAALVGGRAYHVIDQWARYKDDLSAIVLPPYSGLGVYGGIATGFLAAVAYTRWKRQPFLTWADAAAPGLLTMQAVARWGNFFNQELYGPPTNLPWGIAIQCANRTQVWACPVDGGTTPVDAHFVPLFLYESISGLVGAIVLLMLARRARSLRPGDIVLLFFVWYGTTRFLLEPLRTNNWLVDGIPTASIISALAVVGALLALAWRHRPGTVARDRGASEPDVPDRAAGSALGLATVTETAAAEAAAAVSEPAADRPLDPPG
ncbi:MAG: prolipoprotein diacylglyceryl transferase [Candidatus Limnocylindrales bacterium]|jgi:phosphatidylglycerol---prolipoprotein diacylglyceryl transferase|nr:prolipoprotein diacylglyceryl transferase [Candidatus Limnocylindrales bacterium]